MPITEEQNLHSEEVQEIITDTPPWLLRWGLTVFFLVLVSIILFAAFIKMPDKVNGKLIIESANKPEEIIAHTQGKLTHLFVKENSLVDSFAILGYMESNAKPEQVLQINSLMDTIQKFASTNNLESLSNLNLINPQHLGELQNPFLIFSQSFIEFKTFLSRGYNSQKRFAILKEISDLGLQKQRLFNQQKIYEQDFEIATKEFEANKKLLEGKVISSLEYKREESKYLNKKIPLENIESSILGNQSSQNLKKQELEDLANQIQIQKLNFLAKVNQFKSEIDSWKLNHVLQAKTNGKVVFNRFLKQGDFVEPNKVLFYISNKNNGGFIGEMAIGQYALGKVKEGQNVVVRLNAFPYQEYGVLNGKISYLSNQTVSDSIYIARVVFENGAITSYKKRLDLKNGLVAEAEIITKKRSLLTKLFGSLYAMFSNE
ncbi:HlyD family secretion protein [Pedobacter alpinus]|uniref:HlyD family secretion protein n=1 Tax=Pedobacter alpinus TaxID=1590643 RepID=A0ABW5TMH1_9SPHI